MSGLSSFQKGVKGSCCSWGKHGWSSAGITRAPSFPSYLLPRPSWWTSLLMLASGSWSMGGRCLLRSPRGSEGSLQLRRQVNPRSPLGVPFSLTSLWSIPPSFKSIIIKTDCFPKEQPTVPPPTQLTQNAVGHLGSKAPSLCPVSLALTSFILFGDKRLCLKGQFWWSWAL